MTGCQPHKPRQPPPVRHDPLAGISTCTAACGRSVLRCSGRANHRDPVTASHLPGGQPGSGPPPGRRFQQRVDMGESAWGAARRIPTEGRSSVSTEQRENLDAILRQSAFPADSDVNEQRRQLRELLSAQPLPADVTVTAAALGGVPTAEITVDGIEPRHTVLYFHGGVYVMGDAFLAADLASQVGRRTRGEGHLRRLPARPRAPVPGSGRRRPCRLRGPPAGRHSPIGHRLRGRVRRRRARHRHPGQRPRSRAAPARRGLRHVTVCRPHPGRGDHGNQARGRPAVQPRSLPRPGRRLHGGTRPAVGLISPIFADLSGLPPLIIQAGTHEVLLDDAIRLARQAATADVEVTLDITPGVPHVFQAYYPILDEAAAALDRAGQLLSAHLASAERVTA